MLKVDRHSALGEAALHESIRAIRECDQPVNRPCPVDTSTRAPSKAYTLHEPLTN